MIYGFISDSAFVGINTGNKVPYSGLGNLGLITDQLINYFMIPTLIRDPRSASSVGSSNFRLALSSFPSKLDGRVQLHFDEEKRYVLAATQRFQTGVTYYLKQTVNKITSFVETSVPYGDSIPPNTYYVVSEDISVLINSDANLTKFFNIVERCYLSQGETLSQLNSFLSADMDTYGGYVADSLVISDAVVASPCKVVSGGVDGIYAPSPLPTFRKWVQFDYLIPDTTTVVSFKLWLDGEAFLEDYEYTNIVKIVYPCEPNKIISMSFDNTTAAIIAASNYKDQQLADSIKYEDHSGLETFTSKYKNNSVAGWYRLPFSILYKGKQPSFTQMRNAIRDDLLSLNIASIEQWKTVLPDLFADASFYLIPMYSNQLQLPERTITQNIINYKSILNKVRSLYPNITLTQLETYGEILQAPGCGLYIFAFPSIENEEQFRSIKKIHPTYQPIDAINNSGMNDDFESMDELTQDFNETMAICISVCLGTYKEANPLTESDEDHLSYVSFVSNYVEFHMLSQTSFERA